MTRWFTLAVVASLVLAACSSTETENSSTRAERPSTSAPDVDGTLDDEAADEVPVDPAAPSDAGADTGTDTGQGGDAAGPSGDAPSEAPTTNDAEGGQRASDDSGSRARDFGPAGQGVTDSAVKVGFWLLNTDAACNATGAAGQTGRGNCEERSHAAEANALTAWVNDNGGVAGRKLDVVVHETHANNSSWAAQAESACEAFAADEKVFLAISEPQIGRPHFMRCMANKGIPVIDPGTWAWDSHDYEALFPYIYQPSRVLADRWLPAYVDGLAQRDFFEGDVPGDVRVGLVRYDSPVHERATEDVLLPRLAAHGVDDIEEAIVETPGGMSDLGDMNAELSNHILRFKANDVNRVLFFANAEIQFFFYNQAASQNFTPRYGLSTSDWLTLATDNAPDGQLDGALAVGWAPGFDTPRERDPESNAAMQRCQEALASAGIEDSFGGRNVKCDSYFFLKQILDTAPALNVDGIRASVEALGTDYQPVASFAATFGPGRYDGPSVWQHMAYQGDCECFVYEGRSNSF